MMKNQFIIYSFFHSSIIIFHFLSETFFIYGPKIFFQRKLGVRDYEKNNNNKIIEKKRNIKKKAVHQEFALLKHFLNPSTT